MVNAVRRALERLWRDSVTILTAQQERKENSATALVWSVLVEDEPCKLSFYNSISGAPPAQEAVTAAAITQTVKLILRPELEIPAGSRIFVTHGDRLLYFESSGIPELFGHHQEILLKAVSKWA